MQRPKRARLSNRSIEQLKIMQTSPTSFRIDPTPRRADGEYMAHARISGHAADGSPTDVFISGDLGGFDLRADAVEFAIKWAQEWLATRFR
ncbi:hypothetical protein BSFA1_74210 (plasmid) [Burkholderia sp. SFA1]|nr:hypothetical protein BSFA1_74210 [Burkholderia sp. SFA1]